MNKLLAALVAVLVTGVAGFTVAQEAPRPAQPKLKFVETEDEVLEAVVLEESDVYVQRPAQTQLRFINAQQGQAGTWQIVNVDNLAILLNTASGETFSLDKGEDGLRWKPIHRPMPEMPAMPRSIDPRKRDMPDVPNKKGVEDRLEALRKELRNARGEAREKLEKAIEELERNRERKDVEPERKREGDNFEDQMQDLEDKIKDLKERHNESDSIKEREKLQRAINELKEKAENMRKERKKDR